MSHADAEECLKVVSRVIQGCFKVASRIQLKILQGYFIIKGVSRNFQGNFKADQMMFQACLKEEHFKGLMEVPCFF